MPSLGQFHNLTLGQDLIVVKLEQYCVLEVVGEDATTFLHNQLTCDIKNLAENTSTLTAHCDAQGKVTAILRVLKIKPQHFYLIIAKDLVASELAIFNKYAIFAKINLQLKPEISIFGFAGAQAMQTIQQIQPEFETDTYITADYSILKIDYAQPRYIYLTNQAQNIAVTHPSEIWDLLDIQDGIPNLPLTQQTKFLPQAFNLQAIENGISFKKGCYIGQEMVARAKFRGANKRAMFSLVGNSQQPLKDTDELEILFEPNWRKTGEIINYACHANQIWLQVIMANNLEHDLKFRLNPNTELFIYPLAYPIEE